MARPITLLLPILAVGVALWGTTWGWDSDRLLLPELGGYIVVAYALFLGSQLPTYVPGIQKWFDESRHRSLGQDGFGLISRGVVVALISVVLIQGFRSSALWLGSMSIFYAGFGMIVVGILWHLGKMRD